MEFDAVLVGLGNEYKMHHLHGKKLEKTGNHKEIDDIIIKESTLPWKLYTILCTFSQIF